MDLIKFKTVWEPRITFFCTRYMPVCCTRQLIFIQRPLRHMAYGLDEQIKNSINLTT